MSNIGICTGLILFGKDVEVKENTIEAYWSSELINDLYIPDRAHNNDP